MGDVAIGRRDGVPLLRRRKHAPPTRHSSGRTRPSSAPNEEPSFEVVGAYDGMAAIFHVIIAQKGKIDPGQDDGRC